MAEQEGVIKFELDFKPGEPLDYPMLPLLNAWRHICRLAGLIGQDPRRYDGYGFGNISARLASGRPAFVITGSQTGHLAAVDGRHCARVAECDPPRNRVAATGPIPPSSESMTHGMVYLLDEEAGWVIHAHSPEIWSQAAQLDLPRTAADVPYGSPEMAAEVARLWQETGVRQQGIFTMGGHEDGVVAFGPTADAAGTALLVTLAHALELTASR